MTPTKLGEIFTEVSDSIYSQKNQWRFTIKNIPLIAIADSTHNRMRIISPVAEVKKLNSELLLASLAANFHTALDIKYAISDNLLWSIYVHPLKELNKNQVINAISQVYYGNVNYGTTFSSTSLVFPGRQPKPKKEPKKENNFTEKI
ncbi:hypothetical protein WH52_02790 [Tenacibaculum holothuriorum]|uniref:YbjN domain-containing protein n=2 Tax=Tenacibaculum holothuriorum TaxID=1635173 RepID=A0A1Y2PDQ4_9FLAO|nr:hypothetical protein WH52_02790 [Tenacibaculum holothuriorum]